MIGSVRNQKDIKKAADLMKKGEAVTFFNRGVWALIGDGQNVKFLEKVAKIKGAERKNLPTAAFMKGRDLVPYIDLDKIHSDYRHVFSDLEKISLWFGSLCFLRLPVKKNLAKTFPANMLSWFDEETPIIQNWDPIGHRPAEDLVSAMVDEGIKYQAITSLNLHGAPEIIKEEIALEFAKNNDIPLVLPDPQDKKKAMGSFTIFSVFDEVKLVRHGNIPYQFFRSHFGERMVINEAKPANFRPTAFPKRWWQKKHPPEKIREKLLKYLNE